LLLPAPPVLGGAANGGITIKGIGASSSIWSEEASFPSEVGLVEGGTLPLANLFISDRTADAW